MKVGSAAEAPSGGMGPRLTLRAGPSHLTLVSVGPVQVGGAGFVVMAGPCAVESAAQTESAARIASAGGARILRGGVFKPRSSPYAFQGLGEKGARILAETGRRHQMPVVAEVMDVEQIPMMSEYVDLLQVGARNMQNFSLLKALGRTRRPVLLKRHFSATLEEWLLAAEYLLQGGNEQVILCERGIRTFETATRNTLDLSAVPWIKQRSHLPIIVDPSHATGDPKLVVPMALAAAACGADGLLIEVHPRPEDALCDGHQALTHEQMQDLHGRLAPILQAVGRAERPPREKAL